MCDDDDRQQGIRRSRSFFAIEHSMKVEYLINQTYTGDDDYDEEEKKNSEALKCFMSISRIINCFLTFFRKTFAGVWEAELERL